MSSTDNPWLQEPLAQWGRHCSNRPKKGPILTKIRLQRRDRGQGFLEEVTAVLGWQGGSGGYVGKGLSWHSDPFSPLPAHSWVSTPVSPLESAQQLGHTSFPPPCRAHTPQLGEALLSVWPASLPAASTAHSLCFGPRGGEGRLSTCPPSTFRLTPLLGTESLDIY